MRIHDATVEQVIDDEGDLAYRAVCLETGAVCDAWGFVDPDFHAEIPTDEKHGAAIARALDYMSDASLHEWDSPNCCLDATHVMEHDIP